MLKTFMMNNSVDSIEVEECYQKMTRDDRTDRYVTQTLFQLEAKYGTSKEAQLFIQDVIKGPLLFHIWYCFPATIQTALYQLL